MKLCILDCLAASIISDMGTSRLLSPYAIFWAIVLSNSTGSCDTIPSCSLSERKLTDDTSRLSISCKHETDNVSNCSVWSQWYSGVTYLYDYLSLPSRFIYPTLMFALFKFSSFLHCSSCIYTVHLTRSLNQQTNTCTHLVFYLLKLIWNFLKHSYMFRSFDHHQGAFSSLLKSL